MDPNAPLWAHCCVMDPTSLLREFVNVAANLVSRIADIYARNLRFACLVALTQNVDLEVVGNDHLLDFHHVVHQTQQIANATDPAQIVYVVAQFFDLNHETYDTCL